MLIATGLVSVALDFRTTSLDLVPDAVGWVLVVVGAIRIGLVAAACCGGVAGILSSAGLLLPYTYVATDPLTGETLDSCAARNDGTTKNCVLVLRYEPVGDLRAVAIGLAAVVGAAAFALILRELVRRVDALTDASEFARRTLRGLSFVMPVAWAAPSVAVVAVGVAGDGYEPYWTDGLAYVSGFLLVLQVATALLIAWCASQLGRSLDGPRAIPRSFGGIEFGEVGPE